jgi:hypothetical protein
MTILVRPEITVCIQVKSFHPFGNEVLSSVLVRPALEPQFGDDGKKQQKNQ